MITVCGSRKKYLSKDLMNPDFRKEHKLSNTFVGKIGSISGLFIICYGVIVYLNNPECTWDNEDATFEIDKFVNIEIKVY